MQQPGFSKSISSKFMATVIYARKSSESEERQVQSLDDQIRVLKEFACRENIDITEVIQESRSAKNPGQRPEFKRLMQQVEKGKVEGILTWSINRLSRNLVDGGTVAHLLQTGKLGYIRTPERIYRPEDNVLIMAVENGMATGYIQDLSRNVKRGMRGKCARGWYPGVPPIGYVNNRLTKEIEPDPDRFAIIQKGWELLLSGGYSVADIHREFVRLGLKRKTSKSGLKDIPRSTVFALFSKPFYCGEFAYGGSTYKGKHLPMISRLEFDRIQARLERKSTIRPKSNETVFSGVLKCGKCGCAVIASVKEKRLRTSGKTAIYTYYHCTGAKGCPRMSITEDELYDSVAKLFTQFNFTHEVVQWCKEVLENVGVNDSELRIQVRKGLKTELLKLETRRETVKEMRIGGELTAEEHIAEKLKIESKNAEIGRTLEQLEQGTKETDRCILEKIEAATNLANPREIGIFSLRSMLRAVGENHTLTLGKLRLKISPVIRIIAGLEPIKNGYYKHILPASVTRNPVWCSHLENARKIASTEISRK